LQGHRFGGVARNGGADVRGADRLRKAITAIKRRVFATRGEPYKINGHTLRYVVGTKPVSLRRLNPRDPVGHYDALQLKLLSEELREGDIAIDVGASNGSHAIVMAAACGHTGQVVAFEPNPDAREILSQNIKLNAAVKPLIVEASAVSDRAGSGTLYAQHDQSSLVSSFPDAKPVPVSTITLDDYLAQHPDRTPHLIKIDTEGAEIRVLQGAQKILASEATIICEIHPYAWPLFGNSMGELRAIARAHNRRVRYIHENHEIADDVHYGIVLLERQSELFTGQAIAVIKS
jgi:FkbM family methyltransferase